MWECDDAQYLQQSTRIMSGRSWVLVAAIWCIAIVVPVSSAHAATYVWNGKGDGHSWSDPYNWNTALHLTYPGLLPCIDNAQIPAGYDVDVDVDVGVGKLVIDSDATLTVQSVVLAFVSLTGPGTLINYGTITPCGLSGCIASNTVLEDSSGSIWAVGPGQNLMFDGSATLYGDFVVASVLSSFTLGHEVIIFTMGNYDVPAGSSPCGFILGDTSAIFAWNGGNGGTCWR
jgi:hypothetical protein